MSLLDKYGKEKSIIWADQEIVQPRRDKLVEITTNYMIHAGLSENFSLNIEGKDYPKKPKDTSASSDSITSARNNKMRRKRSANDDTADTEKHLNCISIE